MRFARTHLGGCKVRVGRDPWSDTRRWLRGLSFGVVLLVGVLAGLMLGTRACAPAGQPMVSKDDFLVNVATLYSHGESLAAIRSRLSSAGIEDATVPLLDLADRYSLSKDRQQQRQAEDLRQLADALAGGEVVTAVPTAPVARATGTATAIAAKQQATPTTVAEATGSEPPQQTATPVPVASPLPSRGIIQTSDGTQARLRTKPTTQGSEVIEALMPGIEVQILDLVQGEAIDPAEPRWYKVKHGDFEGYVYFKLLRPEG